jgi:glucose-1-phosphate thymidylyltransferase
MFDHHVMDAVNSIQPSARGELEITDTIQYLIDKKLNVRAHLLKGWWIDTGKMSDMLEANRLVLDIIEAKNLGKLDATSHIEGRVVRKNAVVILPIRGPPSSAASADQRLCRSYTSIYHDA